MSLARFGSLVVSFWLTSGAKLRSSSSVEELGVRWERCALEGGECPCSGLVRFGAGDRWVSAMSNGLVSCNTSRFEGDPAFNRLKECWCAGDASSSRARVAIVTLSRHPPDLKTWIRYHLQAGVDHIFLKSEDSPETSATLQQLGAQERAKVTSWAAGPGHGRPADDYSALQVRQMAMMARARDAAVEMGLEWLIHIDDDELLYAPQNRYFGDLLAAVPAAVLQAFLPNMEAVYSSPEVKNCFMQTKQVNVNRYSFQSYANGKSAVRVNGKVQPAGPHLWRDQSNQELPSVHMDQEPFGAPMMVLHYESCPFSRWQDKFWELGNTSPEKLSEIPFPFYRTSIQKMQTCRSQESRVAGCDEASLLQLWSKWKTAANPLLAPEDLMSIHIPWEKILS